jgi:glutaredoxin
MKMPVILVALSMLIAVGGECGAGVYSYSDSRRAVSFVDDASKEPGEQSTQLKSGGLQANVNGLNSARKGIEFAANEPGQTSSKNTSARADIEVFVTSWCGYCRKMLGFLREKGIPFTVHDIERDNSAARVYRELGGTGVPVVRVGSHVVHGYNPEAVMEYYNEGK